MCWGEGVLMTWLSVAGLMGRFFVVARLMLSRFCCVVLRSYGASCVGKGGRLHACVRAQADGARRLRGVSAVGTRVLKKTSVV